MTRNQSGAGASGKQLPPKLPPVSQGSKIQKRALPRDPQPASSNARVVYVSTSKPFMAVVKRVRKQLDKSLQGHAPSTRGMNLAQRINLLHREGGTSDDGSGNNCEVLVRGTGKAIEKTLSVASWFMAQGDCVVDVRTKTIGTVDDVVAAGQDAGAGFEDESRVRRVSCLEVAMKLR